MRCDQLNNLKPFFQANKLGTAAADCKSAHSITHEIIEDLGAGAAAFIGYERQALALDNQRSGRSYPPDFVSAKTLAYRLDCSESTVWSYVQNGLLPKPKSIGNLIRWDFADVIAFVNARNQETADGGDDYLRGIAIASSSQT